MTIRVSWIAIGQSGEWGYVISAFFQQLVASFQLEPALEPALQTGFDLVLELILSAEMDVSGAAGLGAESLFMLSSFLTKLSMRSRISSLPLKT